MLGSLAQSHVILSSDRNTIGTYNQASLLSERSFIPALHTLRASFLTLSELPIIDLAQDTVSRSLLHADSKI